MIHITTIKVLDGKQIHFRFSNNQERKIDFTPFIGDDALSSPLADDDYFKQVKLYENGRGIYWPNEYDFCPDFLHRYQTDEVADQSMAYE